jgi:outer membrane protein assembly factor BamB
MDELGEIPVLKRYGIYGVIIVVVVAAVVYVQTRESPNIFNPHSFNSNSAAPSVSHDPWKLSKKLAAEANDGFRVNSSQSDNVAQAGNIGLGTDWPGFNGTRRDNRSDETGLLARWPSGGPGLFWISEGLGAGFSTVSVVDGVVYTMGNKGASEALMALDVGTGAKIWSTPFAWASHPSAGDGPRGTPLVERDAVYGMGGAGDLVCVERSSGKVRWQKNIIKDFGGQIPYWGVCESVLIDQGRLICTPGGDQGTLVALAPADGSVIWKSVVPKKDRAAYASATIADVGGVRQYIQFTASGTVGVRADSGEFLWRDDSAANGSANCSSPLVSENLVFTSSDYGTGGSLVKLTVNGSKVNARLIYHTHDMQSHHGDMVIVDGLLYGSSDTGILTCLDLPTGKVKWRSRAAAKGAVTYADRRIYLRTEQGTMILVEATGTAYRELGRFEQPKRTASPAWAHPVIAEGRLFLRDQELLLCYDLRTTKS